MLKRTRPDKRIGEIGSIYDTPPCSTSGVNGPPKSANKSFYFHHKDPEFKRLLPQVDRSEYERSDGKASEDSENSVEAKTMDVPASSPKRTVPPHPSEPHTATQSAVGNKEHSLASAKNSTPTCSGEESDYKGRSMLHQAASTTTDKQTKGATNLHIPQTGSIPEIIITVADSEASSILKKHEDVSTQTPVSNAASIRTNIPDPEGTHVTMPSSSGPMSRVTCLPDTQNTSASTQQSEVFSPPIDFLPCTQPTQEDSRDLLATQYKTEDTATSILEDKTNSKAGSSVGRSNSPDFPPSPVTARGKRSRQTAGEVDGTPPAKRSKSPEYVRPAS